MTAKQAPKRTKATKAKTNLKSSKISKKQLKSQKKMSRKPLLTIGLPLLVVVVAIFAYLGYTVRHEHNERGQFSVSDVYVGDNPARSLDLKVAARAKYPSSPITIDRDLGTSDGLHNQLFKYAVKSDNLEEYGLMITPTTPRPANGYPVVVILHGYVYPSRYKTMTGYVSDMEFYAKKGFLVLKPDLRGQGYSIDQGFADSAYYSMAYNTDVMSLISALRQTNYVDKSNINLWGHSMGAYIALRAAVLSPYIKSAILLSGPVDSLPEMYLTYIPPSDENNPYALSTRINTFAKYGTPADDRTFWSDASPINSVAKIKATIQIHAGTADAVVPVRFSQDLNLALQKSHTKHQTYIYRGGSHALADERPQIYQRSLDIMMPKSTTPS
ncbi:alpha/beta fold hydrolase [Candidatus Saccharibacteria bacterium]|nr:alpha/beta fold hydrolase [Candidatus Saccharibacteria bacterium]